MSINRLASAIRNRALYYRDYLTFRLRSNSDRFVLRWKDRHPCLADKTPKTAFDRHYVYHTAWAARILASQNVVEHVDISSYIYFATLVSAFIPVRFYDYRPPAIQLDNLVIGHVDLTALPFADNSISSLSCMHVIEHIGLGRYGDIIAPDADLAAMSELARVLSPDGNLLFVVPVGQPRIAFNAHRIYSYQQIIRQFDNLELLEFSLIPDDPTEGLIVNASSELADRQAYGCGCFWFRKSRGPR